MNSDPYNRIRHIGSFLSSSTQESGLSQKTIKKKKKKKKKGHKAATNYERQKKTGKDANRANSKSILR